MNEKALFKRLDEIIEQLKISNKPEPLIKRIGDGIMMGVSIMGVVTIIETIKIWITGGN